MKVLITKNLFPEDISYIKERINKGIELIIPDNFDEQELIRLSEDADVLFGAFISRNLLKNCRNLKFIQIPWTGVDNLDFDLLSEFDVTVCNSHSNALIIAEHAVALMLDAAKKLSYHDRLLRRGEWNRIRNGQINDISPFSKLVSGSNIGIIGFGSIGTKIYKLLNGFNCNFYIVTKDIPDNNAEYKNVIYISENEIFASLKNLDFVFISVPLTEQTKGFINKDFFNALNPDTILINISRGEVVNEDDLFYALKEKKIIMAAIDTWFNYPGSNQPMVFPSKKNDFHLLDNLVLSPHRAGYIENGFPHLDDAIENLNRYYNKLDLINIVSLKKKY